MPTRNSSCVDLPMDQLMPRAERACGLLALMAHPQRLRVLCLLAEGERSVGQIHAEVDLSKSALSQHLAKLRAERLVSTRKDAQTVYYSLCPGPALALIQTLHQQYCPIIPAAAQASECAGGGDFNSRTDE